MKLNQRVKTPIGHGKVVGRIKKGITVPIILIKQNTMQPQDIDLMEIPVIYAFKPEDLK